MRKEVVYEVEEHSPLPYPEIKGWNKVITETAGFIPLAVRFKQMEQAGFRARFFESEFTSKDMQDMYLNHPEFDITPEDDLEEAYEKMQLRQAWINEVKKQVKERNLAAANEEKDSERLKKSKESDNVESESK